MNEIAINNTLDLNLTANKTLNVMAKFWFLAAVIGQWFMVYYVVVHYGGAIFSGNFDVLESPNGQTSGLIALIAHVALSVIIMGLGPLQLIPQIRKKAPKFHRFNGRLFITTIFIGSIIGLYMIWGDYKMPGGMSMFIAMNLMVFMILSFAIIAVRFAIKREIKQHRKWALRLFMVVNSGWFFRVGLMAWLIINNGAVGFNPETFEGPFIIILAFAQYLLPLLLLEAYFWARDKADTVGKYCISALLCIATIVMSVGIFGAIMSMWLPNV